MTVPRRPAATYLRCAISVLLIAHLSAVVLPPLAFQTSGPIGQSPLIAAISATPLERYGQFLYIDRGYAFFAPDPGPSHLVQVAVTERDGQRIERMIPNRNVHWPRLLYHRHFMLTEFLNEIHQPPGPPPALIEAAPQEAEYWRRARKRYEHVRQSVVDHLKHQHPGREVAIRRIEHLIPDVVDYRLDPVSLVDQESYRVMLDQPIAAEPLAADRAFPMPAGGLGPLLPNAAASASGDAVAAPRGPYRSAPPGGSQNRLEQPVERATSDDAGAAEAIADKDPA